MEELETIIMELLVNAGATHGQALTVLRPACRGDFAGAEQAVTESRECVKQAREIQAQLVGIDEGTNKLPANLITIRSQNHLMNATMTQDLTGDMIEFYRWLLPIN